MKKIICLLSALIMISVMLTSCGDSKTKKESFNEDTKQNTEISDFDFSINDDDDDDSSKSVKSDSGTVGLGEEFVFEGLQIKFFDMYEVFTCEEEYSEQYGNEVIKLPISIENVSKESTSFGVFYTNFFGSNGTEIDDLYYSYDDSINANGYVRPGCGKTGYLYFVYDGDGEYAVEFDNFEDKLEVVFDIKKENSCDTSNIEAREYENTSIDGALDLNACFTFDGFEIKFKGSCEKVVLDDEYSDYNNCPVVRIPVTVTNKSGETGSFGTYDIYSFGSHGTQIYDVSYYFDDSVYNAGEMRDGSSIDAYLYYIYDGAGLYALEFDNLFDEFFNVEFNVD